MDEYQQAQFDIISGEVTVEIKGLKKGNIYTGDNVKIAPTAKLIGTVVIGSNTTIADHAEIINCSLGSNVSIGMGARLRNSTLWNNIKVGDFAQLSDDVICNDTSIGNSATISENVFIAEGCTIGSRANLMANIKLWPMKHVEVGAVLSRSMVQEEKWLRELFTDARISGFSNIEINPEFGAKLGAAIGMTHKQNSAILASRDPDLLSRILKRTITSGLSSVGINVNDLQTISIPQTRQEIRTGKYAGGIHVRRSPRNPDMTDIIIFNQEGRDISIAKTKAIERYFFGEDNSPRASSKRWRYTLSRANK